MLEAFRRRLADDLDGWRRDIDEAGRSLVAAGVYPDGDAYRREVAAYTAQLLTTVSAMDGDISPDEMLAMLFAGQDGVASPRDYFATIEAMQHDLLHRSESLETIPTFLDRAAEHDAVHGTDLAATTTAALLGLAAGVTVADRAANASERLFLDGYRLQLAAFLRDRGLVYDPTG